MVPQADTVAPPKEGVKPMTPKQELEALEQEVLVLGMPPEELEQIQEFGECPDQVRVRIAELRRRKQELLSRGQ